MFCLQKFRGSHLDQGSFPVSFMTYRKSSIKPPGAYLILGLKIQGGLIREWALIERGAYSKSKNFEKIHINFSNFNYYCTTETEHDMGYMLHV